MNHGRGYGPLDVQHDTGPATTAHGYTGPRHTAGHTAGHVAVTELFYRPSNPDCCPSGRAVTIWKWTGRTFIPGRTKIAIR